YVSRCIPKHESFPLVRDTHRCNLIRMYALLYEIIATSLDRLQDTLVNFFGALFDEILFITNIQLRRSFGHNLARRIKSESFCAARSLIYRYNIWFVAHLILYLCAASDQ